jgi:hypothetical protein
MIVKADAPGSKLPMEQVTVEVPVQEGPAKTSDAPGGSTSVKVTPVAWEGPSLVTEMLY